MSRTVIRRSLLGLLLLMGMSGMSTAGVVNPPVSQAINQFARAAEGDKDAVGEAMQQFELLAQQYPNHPWVEARLGSLMTMQARDAWAPWDKMRYVEQGLERIDAALERIDSGQGYAVLGEIQTRFDVALTAASTFIALPKFFNRWGQAGRLLSDLAGMPAFASTPASFQAEVWLLRARLIEQRGDNNKEEYQSYLRKAVAVDPNGKNGKQAQALLAQGSKS